VSLGKGLAIAELGAKVFDAVVAHYAAAAPPIAALPARRYIAPGDAITVPWDCEQLTVSCQAIGYGPAPDTGTLSAQDGGNYSVFGIRHAVFAVQLVRCVATMSDNGDPPPVATMQADGLRSLRDSGMLSQALTELASRMRQGLGRGIQIQTGDVVPVGPEGEFMALVAGFTVTAGDLM
jgi:hypothetical protein